MNTFEVGSIIRCGGYWGVILEIDKNDVVMYIPFNYLGEHIRTEDLCIEDLITIVKAQGTTFTTSNDYTRTILSNVSFFNSMNKRIEKIEVLEYRLIKAHIRNIAQGDISGNKKLPRYISTVTPLSKFINDIYIKEKENYVY